MSPKSVTPVNTDHLKEGHFFVLGLEVPKVVYDRVRELDDYIEAAEAKVKALEEVVEAAQKMHDWLCDLEKMGYPKGHAPICTALGLAAALSRLQATDPGKEPLDGHA